MTLSILRTLVVLFLAAGFFESRVKNFFLQTGVEGDFHFQFGYQLRAFFHSAIRRFAELGQQGFYSFVVGFQQINGVHARYLQGHGGETRIGLCQSR
mgnify:CR=1 FL=1